MTTEELKKQKSELRKYVLEAAGKDEEEEEALEAALQEVDTIVYNILNFKTKSHKITEVMLKRRADLYGQLLKWFQKHNALFRRAPLSPSVFVEGDFGPNFPEYRGRVKATARSNVLTLAKGSKSEVGGDIKNQIAKGSVVVLKHPLLGEEFPVLVTEVLNNWTFKISKTMTRSGTFDASYLAEQSERLVGRTALLGVHSAARYKDSLSRDRQLRLHHAAVARGKVVNKDVIQKLWRGITEQKMRQREFTEELRVRQDPSFASGMDNPSRILAVQAQLAASKAESSSMEKKLISISPTALNALAMSQASLLAHTERKAPKISSSASAPVEVYQDVETSLNDENIYPMELLLDMAKDANKFHLQTDAQLDAMSRGGLVQVLIPIMQREQEHDKMDDMDFSTTRGMSEEAKGYMSTYTHTPYDAVKRRIESWVERNRDSNLDPSLMYGSVGIVDPSSVSTELVSKYATQGVEGYIPFPGSFTQLDVEEARGRMEAKAVDISDAEAQVKVLNDLNRALRSSKRGASTIERLSIEGQMAGNRARIDAIQSTHHRRKRRRLKYDPSVVGEQKRRIAAIVHESRLLRKAYNRFAPAKKWTKPKHRGLRLVATGDKAATGARPEGFERKAKIVELGLALLLDIRHGKLQMEGENGLGGRLYYVQNLYRIAQLRRLVNFWAKVRSKNPNPVAVTYDDIQADVIRLFLEPETATGEGRRSTYWELVYMLGEMGLREELKKWRQRYWNLDKQLAAANSRLERLSSGASMPEVVNSIIDRLKEYVNHYSTQVKELLHMQKINAGRMTALGSTPVRIAEDARLMDLIAQNRALLKKDQDKLEALLDRENRLDQEDDETSGEDIEDVGEAYIP